MTDLAIFAVARRGADLGATLCRHLGGDLYLPRRLGPLVQGKGVTPLTFERGGIRASLAEAFGCYQKLVLIMPVGAAVRLIAPCIGHKGTDPAVVTLDEVGAHAVALLAGHVGGANELARAVAAVVGARPVISTAAEALSLPALDLLGKEWGWRIEDPSGLTRASAALIDGEPVGAYQDAGEEDWWPKAPSNVLRYPSAETLMAAPLAARLLISDRVAPNPQPPAPSATVVYRPRTLVVGVGCVRGATADELDALIRATMDRHGLAFASVRELATIDVKRAESGLSEVASRYGWAVRYFSAAELSVTDAPSGGSETVLRAVGTGAVCEPAALVASGATGLLVPKTSTRRATVAVARAARKDERGHLAVVGLGPGAPEELTVRAREALEAAEVVVGYQGYLDLVRGWLGTKQYHGSPIGEETERCLLAIELAHGGRAVALVSSGDAGVYGTAGIVFELLRARGLEEQASEVEVVPGVSAVLAAASLLGAPLMNDFAAISLSDLMTPWAVIERRLEATASADLVVALYNPASSRRRDQLAQARAILLRHRPADTPVGIVRNAFRPGQQVTITDLASLLEQGVDMLTLVIIGNSATVRVGDRLVTRRGYLDG